MFLFEHIWFDLVSRLLISILTHVFDAKESYLKKQKEKTAAAIIMI